MKLSNEIKKEVQSIVTAFNKKHKSNFSVRFRSKYVYLDKLDWFNTTKVGRLRLQEDMKSWSFDVFKYSSEQYDPNEFFFPGMGELDGTIEGALRAGLEIY